MSVLHITKDNFDELALHSDKPVLLDFFATWCGPCKMQAPVLEEIAQERSDLTVGKIDVDAEMELAMRYGVSSIPTLIVLKQGEVAAKLVGYTPKDELLEHF